MSQVPCNLTAGDHCCKWFNCALQDTNIGVNYHSEHRAYSFDVVEFYSFPQPAYFTICPWCGKQLPASLRSKWEELLEKDYGIEGPFYDEFEDEIPSEFKSDEWWKKRGL